MKIRSPKLKYSLHIPFENTSSEAHVLIRHIFNIIRVLAKNFPEFGMALLHMAHKRHTANVCVLVVGKACVLGGEHVFFR